MPRFRRLVICTAVVTFEGFIQMRPHLFWPCLVDIYRFEQEFNLPAGVTTGREIPEYWFV